MSKTALNQFTKTTSIEMKRSVTVLGCAVAVTGCAVVGCEVVGCEVVGCEVVGCEVVGCAVAVTGCEVAFFV